MLFSFIRVPILDRGDEGQCAQIPCETDRALVTRCDLNQLLHQWTSALQVGLDIRFSCGKENSEIITPSFQTGFMYLADQFSGKQNGIDARKGGMLKRRVPLRACLDGIQHSLQILFSDDLDRFQRIRVPIGIRKKFIIEAFHQRAEEERYAGVHHGFDRGPIGIR